MIFIVCARPQDTSIFQIDSNSTHMNGNQQQLVKGFIKAGSHVRRKHKRKRKHKHKRKDVHTSEISTSTRKYAGAVFRLGTVNFSHVSPLTQSLIIFLVLVLMLASSRFTRTTQRRKHKRKRFTRSFSCACAYACVVRRTCEPVRRNKWHSSLQERQQRQPSYNPHF